MHSYGALAGFFSAVAEVRSSFGVAFQTSLAPTSSTEKSLMRLRSSNEKFCRLIGEQSATLL